MKRKNPLLISAVVLFCTMPLVAANTPTAGQTINTASRGVVVAEPNPPTQGQTLARPLERGRDCGPDEATSPASRTRVRSDVAHSSYRPVVAANPLLCEEHWAVSARP